MNLKQRALDAARRTNEELELDRERDREERLQEGLRKARLALANVLSGRKEPGPGRERDVTEVLAEHNASVGAVKDYAIELHVGDGHHEGDLDFIYWLGHGEKANLLTLVTECPDCHNQTATLEVTSLVSLGWALSEEPPLCKNCDRRPMPITSDVDDDPEGPITVYGPERLLIEAIRRMHEGVVSFG